jgi:dTDP-4-amino-4,6-dideoxygalactose transaminase
MVTTNDPDLGEKVEHARNHGAGPDPEWKRRPLRPYDMSIFDALGFNLRMSDIQAAVGVAQMAKLDGLLAERAECARYYDEMISEIEEIVPPFVPPKSGHTYQSYVIRVRDGDKKTRNGIMDFLQENGIQTRPGTHAVHRLGYYRDKYGLRPEDFPNSAAAEDISITLPLFPGMTEEDLERVVRCLKTAFGSLRKG